MFLGSSLGYHWKHLKTFPTQIHAWAQCDYISISEGFKKNNFNFFLPQQNNYNKEFENIDSTANTSIITSADFPIIPFTNAIISEVSGKTVYKTYRALTLFISCIGLTFLFLIGYHYSNSILIAFCSTIIFSITPIYLDYQDGYLPSICALSFLFIGFYFLIKANDGHKNHLIKFAFTFLCLAALVRFPFVIFLIAIIGVEFIENPKIKSFLKSKHTSYSILAFVIIGGYFVYNLFLRNKYGSIFLGASRLPTSFDEFYQIIMEIQLKWGLSYFTISQYFIISLITLIGIVKLSLIQNLPNQSKVSKIFFIAGIGIFLYSVLMFRQFRNHDYYSLDTFLPLIAISGVIFVSKLVAINNLLTVKKGFLLFLVCTSLFQATNKVATRREFKLTDGNQIIFKAFSNSDNYLSSLGVSSSDKILVLDSFSPNMPLLLMKRNGYSLRSSNFKKIELALNWDYDYLVCSNYFLFDKVLNIYPEIINHMHVIDRNKELTVIKRNSSKKWIKKNLLTFLNVSNGTKFINDSDYQNWGNYHPTFSDANVGKIDKGNLYGAIYENYITEGSLLKYTGYITDLTESNNAKIVIEISNSSGNYFYKSVELKSLKKEENRHLIEIICPLPMIRASSKLKLYFYNSNNDKFNFKDLNVTVF